jgi:serine/threonine-protein kinase
MPPEPVEPPEPPELPPAGAAVPATASAAPASAEPAEPASVKTLDFGPGAGSFEILRPLGEGGMASVHLALHRGQLGFEQLVALKTIRTPLAGKDTFRKMFLTEAHLASKLRHRNIAAVYGLQRQGDAFYLVMEYVPGCTLRDALNLAVQKGRRFSEQFAVHVAAEIADALHHAHSVRDLDGQPLGIIHRDVTPNNIMLAEHGDVKLMDFGVAYSLLRDRERTETGLIKGKFAYLSPEQARGTDTLDGRSDLFALGLVLAETLTGHRVFDGMSDLQVLQSVENADPTCIDAAVQSLSSGLQAIVRKVLAKEPDARYQNGAEMARTLRSYATQSGYVLSGTDAVLELEKLRELPDVVAEPTSASIRPVVSAAKPIGRSTTDEAGPSSVADAATDPKRLEKIRDRLRAPQTPTRRIAVLSVIVLAVIVVGNVLVTLVFRSHAGEPKVAVVKTDQQKRSERELEDKQLAADTAAPVLAPPTEPADRLLAQAANAMSPTQLEERSPTPATPAPTAAAPAPTAAAPAAPAGHRRRAAKAAPAEPAQVPPEPPKRVLYAGSSSVDFADARPAPAEPGAGSPSAPAAGGASGRLDLAPGTLIAGKLLLPADPNAAGPVSAEVTRPTIVGGVTIVPKGATLVCASRGLSGKRVSITCSSVVIEGASHGLSGVILGADKRPGLAVTVSGGGGGGEPVRSGALSTAADVASQLIPGVGGIGSTLARHAIRTGTDTADSATKPAEQFAEPAPAGTPFFLFVQGGGGF